MRSAIAVAFSFAVIMGHLHVGGWELIRPDAKQYAAMAERWMSTGQYQGVLTRQTEVATLDGPVPGDPWPASYARPGFPLLLMGAFRALGDNDVSYHMVNVVFFCLLGWSVFQISTQLGGPRAGWFGLALLALSGDLIWEGLYSGLEMPYMALAMLCGVMLMRATDWKGAVAAGSILAFVIFMRPTALAFLPLALLLLPRPRQQRHQLAACFLGAVLVLTATGNVAESRLNPPPMNPQTPFNHMAFNLMLETPRFPGITLDSTFQAVDWDMVKQHRGQITTKLARGLADTPVRLAAVVPFWLLLLAVWGIAGATHRSELASLGWALSVVGLLLILGMNLTTAYTLPRHFLTVVALLIPIGAVGLNDVLGTLRRQPSVWRVAGVVALGAVIGYGALFRIAEKTRIPDGLGGRHVALQIQGLTDYQEPVGASYSLASDVTWYGRRRVVVLPTAPEDCRHVVEMLLPNSALVIGEYDQAEVFAGAEDLFPEHDVAGAFTVQTSQWASPYYILRHTGVGPGRGP